MQGDNWGDVGDVGDIGTAHGGGDQGVKETDWTPDAGGNQTQSQPGELHRLVGDCIGQVAELAQHVEMLHSRQLELQAQLGELQAKAFNPPAEPAQQ